MIEDFRRRRTRLFDLLVLTALSAVVIFPALGQNREWASHEIRHAEIIREMAENGDYLIPRLMGEVYHDKPPVMHAIAAVLTRMAGKPSMTIARMPSAVAGILGVLAVYGIGLSLLDRRSALIGAIALLGMPGYSVVARHARPDMIMCASILCSCLCIGLGMRERRHAWQTFYLTFGGLCAGLGVITKGPYGILVPAFFAVFAPFRREDLKRPQFNWASFVLGFLTALAIWAVPAYLRDGGHYLRGVIFQPDLDVSKGGGGKSVFLYVWYAIIFTFPYSLFLPLAIRDLRRRGYSAPFAIAGAIFIVISCIPKKRQHYLVPIYPFFALGIAASLVRYRETSRLVRCVTQILIPLSIIAIPLYFVVIQPFAQPYKNSQMFFAKEILRTIEPNSRIYCVTGIDEVLAWVGRGYEEIRKLDRNDPSIDTILREAAAESYLVISEKNLTSLLKGKETIPSELILNRKVGHEEMMLFRLKGKRSEVP